MTRAVRRTALLAVVLAATAAAEPAGAQAPPPPAPPPVPDERAAAREFAFAAYRARVAVKAQKAPIEAALMARLGALDDPTCRRAIMRAPERVQDRVVGMTIILTALPLLDGIRAPVQQLVAELERVPTADVALRRGRAAWRVQAEFLTRLPAVPDMCVALDAWRRAGYAPRAAPIDLAALAGLGDTAEAKLAACAARMRELGVSAGAARRFTGTNFLDGIGDDVPQSRGRRNEDAGRADSTPSAARWRPGTPAAR
jgi:hypothetical protein